MTFIISTGVDEAQLAGMLHILRVRFKKCFISRKGANCTWNRATNNPQPPGVSVIDLGSGLVKGLGTKLSSPSQQKWFESGLESKSGLEYYKPGM